MNQINLHINTSVQQQDIKIIYNLLPSVDVVCFLETSIWSSCMVDNIGVNFSKYKRRIITNTDFTLFYSFNWTRSTLHWSYLNTDKDVKSKEGWKHAFTSKILNHVITNSISKNEYFTPRHFLRSCINALPTIIALRKIRSGHPNVIPDVVVPNGISCVVVRYALTILIVIFFYRTSWISVMGRTEVCHWPTWNSKGSANWKKDASLFTSKKMNCRYHLFNYWKNYNKLLSNSYLKRRPQKTPNIAHILLLFFLCFPCIPPRFWCSRSTPMALFHPHMRNLHSANFLLRFLDHHWHLPMNNISLILYLNSFRISFAYKYWRFQYFR